MADVSDAIEFNAALANTNITKITLTGAITTGTINTIDRSIEIELAGNNITPTLTYTHGKGGTSKIITSTGTATVNQVDVDTPAASFIQGSNVTITTLNLIDTLSATYTNNGTITKANITDNDARFLNEGNVDELELDNVQGNVTLGGSAPIAKVTVTNAASLNVASGTTINNLVANGATTVNNEGTLKMVSGDEAVTVKGTGKVEEVTNDNVSTPEITEANQSLVKSNDFGEADGQGVYSSSFTWKSTNGIGSGVISKHTSPGGYNYFGNGAYLDITVKKDGDNLKFADVLSSLTLQTNDGNVDEISGKDTGRQASDWGKSGANHRGTDLRVKNSNSVFYGVRQNNTNGVATVGFNAEDSRRINLTATPKDDLATGTYTITIQPKQQVSETSGTTLGEAITYTFTK